MSGLLRPRFSIPRFEPAQLGCAVIFVVAVSACLVWGWSGLCSLRKQIAEHRPSDSPLIFVPPSTGPELEYWGLVR